MKLSPPSGRRGFTLIELILVMALITVVMALISPSLGGFLRGRSMQSEVSRFISLTHYAQARAAHEGIPMRLWVDPELRTYGLASEYVLSQGGQDPRLREYELASDLEVEVDNRSFASLQGNRLALQDRWAAGQPMSGQTAGSRSQVVFRFTPDGFIDETSPLGLWFRHKPLGGGSIRRGQSDPRDEVYVGQNLMRLRYEVQTNQLYSLRR